jgi:lysyl-tRNA synthetase class II
VSVTGRVVLSRVGGKLCFATLQEGDAQLQVMVSLDGVGADGSPPGRPTSTWATSGDGVPARIISRRARAS